MSLNGWERVKAAYFLLFTGKRERRAAKPGPEEKKPIIKPAPEETEVISKPAPEEKGPDAEGRLKTYIYTHLKNS